MGAATRKPDHGCIGSATITNPSRITESKTGTRKVSVFVYPLNEFDTADSSNVTAKAKVKSSVPDFDSCAVMVTGNKSDPDTI